jgi:hypothetical protein
MTAILPTSLLSSLFVLMQAAATPGAAGQTSAAAPQPRAVTFRDGLLSVSPAAYRLDRLVEQISQQADVAVVGMDVLDGATAAVQIDALPVDQALRRILAGHDAFFYYGAEQDQPAKLRVVWVYRPGGGRGLEPIPPDVWASTKELEERTANPDPEVRAAAIEELIERKRERSLDAALRGLRDEDSQVRTRALYAALSGGLELPAAALKTALADSSENVRFLALDALATGDNARAVAKGALQDPSAFVRARAQEILAGLDAASRPRPPAGHQRPPKL